ncbi:MAG: DegT/DnrJ/EryC1/StrS family aminotransferase [Rhizobiaceae bacterium]
MRNRFKVYRHVMSSSSHDPIQWYGPQLAGDEAERVKAVIESDYINDGPLCRELEKQVAVRVGTAYAVAVTSGTAAIALGLMAAGVKPGDDVIVPDLTFAATANAVLLAGARPVFCDIEANYLGIDVTKLSAALTSKTTAVVPVDVNGRGADYRVLESFCKENDLRLICDAAEALGSRFGGKPLGSFGDAGCFSFSANKTITAGQGGMITTDDEEIHNRLRELKDQGRRFQGTGGNDLHPVLGFNFKMTDLQAAVALAQMDEFDERMEAARHRDSLYRRHLEGVAGLTISPDRSNEGEVLQWFDIFVDDRYRVEKALTDEKIGCRPFWFPLHSQGAYGKNEGDFPVAKRVSERGLWLPSRFDLSDDDIARVCGIIKEALSCANA